MPLELNMFQCLVYVLWNPWRHRSIILRIWDATAHRPRLLLPKAFIKERLHIDAQIQPLVPFDWTIRYPCMHLVNYYVFCSIHKHKSASVLIFFSENKDTYIALISNLQFHRELLPTPEIHLYDEVSVDDVQFSLRAVRLIGGEWQLVPIDKVNISFDRAVEVLLQIARAYLLVFVCRTCSSHHWETLLGVGACIFIQIIAHYLKQLGVQYTVCTWCYEIMNSYRRCCCI